MALLNDREAQEWIERANTAEAEVKRLRECIDKCRKSAELEASPDGPSGDVTNLLHRGDLALRDYGDLADGIEAREDELVHLQRIVDSVQSKTALDVVTDKMAAEDEAKRLRHVMAAALERTQVDDCGEATMILEAEIKLDGSPADKDNNDADTG